MSHSIVSIIRRSDNSLVDARLLDGVGPVDLLVVEREWTPERSMIMMSDTTKNTGPRSHWLREMAGFEDSCRAVSVGGMAADLGMLPPVSAESHGVFGRLIEYARRSKGLSVEQLAQQADVDLAEIVEIERHENAVPQLRTVYQLANALKLPAGKLAEVAGLATPQPVISDAALRFAARSEPTARLTRVEREAFEEFVKVLVEASDGG
ncbi:MAG: helix-turn-helix domain-containing protein [Pirellulales bacterium]